MSAELENRVPKRARRRGASRSLIAAVPVLVWVIAIVAALHLHERVGFVGMVSGFADDRPVTLAHLEPGIVREVHVRLHDDVLQSQVLISMDDRRERTELAAIEKDIERLSAEVLAEKARLDGGNARATADVDDLTRRFVIDRETTHIDYLSQLAVNARDQILLRGAITECEIVRALHDRGNAAFRELNDIQTEVDSLEATLARNAEVLEKKQKVFEQADQRWIRFMEGVGVATPYEPVLTPLRLAIDVRERDIEEVVRRIDSHVLRATVGGQVTGLLAHAGDRVQAGAPLVTISPTSTNRVVAYLPERMILSARVGAPVSVDCVAAVTDSRRGCTGTVESFSATVSETPPRYRPIPTYPTWGRALFITLEDGVRLIPGEAVRIAFLDQP